jgi:hypothetical protein
MHSIYPVPDPRAPIALGEPVATVPATFRGFLAGGPVQWHEISTAPSGAHGAAMLRLPAGWRSPASQAAATLEMFTIDAGLTFDDAAPAESSAGSYARIRMGERVPAIAAATDVTLFVTFGDI